MEETVTPERSALIDSLVRYEIAAASERRERDRLVATWRDVLHQILQSPGGVDAIKNLHSVIDSMDSFLNHGGGRRK